MDLLRSSKAACQMQFLLLKRRRAEENPTSFSRETLSMRSSRVGGEKPSFCQRRKRNSPYALSKQHSSLTKRYVARGERMKREYFPRLPK